MSTTNWMESYSHHHPWWVTLISITG